jgi:hypothetical protein
MSRLTFNRGMWETGDAIPEWNDAESSIDYLSRIGYSTVSATYGNEHGSQIEIFESLEGETFFAFVTPTGGTSHEVFLPDFQSYMLFIKDYAAPFAAGGINSQVNELLELTIKLFRVQHGHDPSTACAKCDPEEHKRRTEFSRKMRNEL